jgi:transcriptional regulator with XRE-family HTH domain
MKGHDVDYARGNGVAFWRRLSWPMTKAQKTGARKTAAIGDHLKNWRRQRRLSQLDLALATEISTRHLSFIETGRAAPSREMVLRLADHLDVPLRQRNQMLLAAGFAPVYPERSLDDPALADIRAVIDRLLTAHEPWPALAIDRHWHMLAANRGVAPLLAGVAPELLQGPINVLRLALHPAGLAPRILNLGEWRHHLLARLGQQIEATADTTLIDLQTELKAYPAPANDAAPETDMLAPAVKLRLRSETGVLEFLSATMLFGAPHDVTLAELAIETFLPADETTAAALIRAMS